MAKKINQNRKKRTSKNKSTNSLSILGLILAIFLAPIGLVVSIIALRQLNEMKQQGKSIAIAGIAIGAVLTIINAAVLIPEISSIRHSQTDLAAHSTGKAVSNNLPPVGSSGYNIESGQLDAERTTDINAISGYLTFFPGAYPVLADLNSTVWRQTHNHGLDGAAFCDPQSTSGTIDCQLVATPTKNMYSYQAWEADGVTPCTAQPGQTCPKYTLTTILLNGNHNHTDPGNVYYTKHGS